MSSIEKLNKILDIKGLLNMIEQSYAFLCLDNDIKISLNEKAATKALDVSNINLNKLKKIFQDEYNNYAKSQLEDYNKYNIIENYLIDKNESDFITQISNLFGMISATFDIDMALYLLNDEARENYIKNMYEKNKQLILEHGIEVISKNEVLITFIDAYCNKNNIDLYNEESLSVGTLINVNKKKKSSNKDIYDEDALVQYFNMLPSKLLSREEEKELIIKIREGDKKAEEKFIKHNLKLVIPIARRYQSNKTPILDLIQEGNQGLMEALSKFDLDKHCKFSTYATWWVKQRIIRYIDNTKKDIRIPVNKLEKLKKLNNCIDSLEKRLGRKPSIDEISSEINLSVKKIKELLECNHTVVSYDAPIKDDGDTLLQEVLEIPNEESLEDSLTSTFLNSELYNIMKEVLNERELKIIIQHFGLNNEKPLSLEKIAVEFGISRQRIGDIIKIALKKLKEPLSKKQLATHIGIGEDIPKTKIPQPNKQPEKYIITKYDEEILELLKNITEKESILLKENLGDYLYNVLKRKFGKNFGKIVNLSDKEEKICKYKLYPYLKKLLRDYRGYYYFDQIFNISNEAIKLEAFSNLELVQQRILLYAYGDTLSNCVNDNISKEQKRILKRIVDNKLNGFTSKYDMEHINRLNNSLNMFNGNYNLYNLSSNYNIFLGKVYEVNDYKNFEILNYRIRPNLEESLKCIVKVILTNQEYEVVDLFYGLNSNMNLDYETIALKLNKNKKRISELHNNAILKLRLSPQLRKIFIKLNENTKKDSFIKNNDESLLENGSVNFYGFFTSQEIKYLDFAIRKLTADDMLLIFDIFSEGLDKEILLDSLSEEDHKNLIDIAEKLKTIIKENKDINYRKVFALSQYLYNNPLFEIICNNLDSEEREIFGEMISCTERNVEPVEYVSKKYNLNKRILLNKSKEILKKISDALNSLKNQNNLVRKLINEQDIKVGSENE